MYKHVIRMLVENNLLSLFIISINKQKQRKKKNCLKNDPDHLVTLKKNEQNHHCSVLHEY